MDAVSSFMKKLESLKTVVNHLESASKQRDIPNDFWIPAIITYFELSFELSWKILRKGMQDRHIDAASTSSPRDIITLACTEHYIADFELWLRMLEDKNAVKSRCPDEISRDILDRVCTIYLAEFKRLTNYLSACI